MEKKNKKQNTIITSPRKLLTARRSIAVHRRRRFKNDRKWEEKFKVRLVGMKREMEEMSKDQELIGMQQMEIKKKIEDFRDKCAEIRQESEQIMKKQASNQLLLQFIFNVLRARNNGGN